MADKNIKINDKVARAGTKGPFGLVTDIRKEITATGDSKEHGLLIQVLWDNGTNSYFSPEGLAIITPTK